MSKEYTSYELSKRLHDKGFALERDTLTASERIWESIHGDVPYYTFTELWGALPYEIDGYLSISIWKEMNGDFACAYVDASGLTDKTSIYESPAEAAGLMLEWLIDNNYMEVKR